MDVVQFRSRSKSTIKFIVPIVTTDPDAELHHDINRRIRRDASRHHSSRLTKMTQPLTFVVLSTGLENFKEIRAALTHDSRAQLLAGGNDPEQLYERFDSSQQLPSLRSVETLSSRSVIQRLNVESPATAVISAAQDASPDLILRSLRAGAREFLRLPYKEAATDDHN